MKLSVKQRLYLSFTAAILLVITVTIISFVSIQRQVSEAAWVNHTYQVMSKLENVQRTLVDMETARRGYRSTGNPAFLVHYNESVPIIRPAIRELKDMVQDNQMEQTKAKLLEQKAYNLLTFWQGLGTQNKGLGVSTKEFSPAEIQALTNNEEEQMNDVRAVINDMTANEDTLLRERQAQLKKANESAELLLIVSILLIFLVIITLGYFIFREFSTRNRAEKKLQKNITQLEKLTAKTTQDNWILKGVSEINDCLQQGINDERELADKILRSMTTYFQIPAGAFYLYNAEEKVLEVAATYALDGAVKQKVKLHEGLLGEAATRRKTSTVKVPADYINIQSVTITAPVAQVTFLPLYVQNELKGVVELLSFQQDAQEADTIDLSDVVSNNIAAALSGIQERKRIINLFEQVQLQQESLLTQQEELRQTNEELNRQTEELQASEEELRTQEEELRQINTELEEKNEAVETARQSLIQKAKELEITSKYKSEFLANMSHELRTPLNSVLILAKLLADNNAENLTTKQVEYANIIHKSGNDLLELINDILDLSKIEAGKVELTIEDVTINSIVQHLRQLFGVLASEKGVNYIINVPGDIEQLIQTDKQRVEQVLRNLLSNAFKFTRSKGTVTLSFSARRKFDVSMLAISVTDTGIGISESQQKIIFEAFQQADGSTSRKYGGTGLGLSISKELMRLLKGEIELHSEEGKGSTFTILLPYAYTTAHEKHTETIAQRFIQPPSTEIIPQKDVSDNRDDIHPGDKVMLIIEDDILFARIVSDFAQQKGYKVVVATQGDEGLQYAKQYIPAAIILDVQLPIIDGWSLLNLFKNDDSLKHIPVHIISAFDNDQSVHNGAFAYLKKPVDKQALEDAFTSLGLHLQEQMKKILILSVNHFQDDKLQHLFHERHRDVQFHHVQSVDGAIQLLQTNEYDCLIADIGNQVTTGVNSLEKIRREDSFKNTPIIIYLDTDISSADELQLKKFSDVIVRNSSAADNRLTDELELFLYNVQETRPRSSSTDNGPAKDTRDISLINKKVLLVDDDMRNVFALSTALETQQMNIITASDGRESLELLQLHPDIDIVLMDIMMPEMDGYEAIRHIRQDMKLTRLPIIALTAKAMTGDREKCIEAGASDYITKPVNIQKLFSLMRVWLAS